jgi:hypothetical protein
MSISTTSQPRPKAEKKNDPNHKAWWQLKGYSQEDRDPVLWDKLRPTTMVVSMKCCKTFLTWKYIRENAKIKSRLECPVCKCKYNKAEDSFIPIPYRDYLKQKRLDQKQIELQRAKEKAEKEEALVRERRPDLSILIPRERVIIIEKYLDRI